jgi:hypothetical protein
MTRKPLEVVCGGGKLVKFELVRQNILDLIPGITSFNDIQLVTSERYIVNCCRCKNLADRTCDVGSANGNMRPRVS